GCAASHSGLPPPVRYPAMSYMSLTAAVRPAKGPAAAPATGAARSCGTNADRAVDIALPRIQLESVPLKSSQQVHLSPQGRGRNGRLAPIPGEGAITRKADPPDPDRASAIRPLPAGERYRGCTIAW